MQIKLLTREQALLPCLLCPHFPLTYLIHWPESPLITTGDFMAQDTVWDKHTWIFKMPATWVVEGVIVNFHSDLQRPFLKKTVKQKLDVTPLVMKKIPTDNW